MVKQATFRFYEELNDFLPLNKRKVNFIHTFQGGPSIKDVIENIGIPHVEVDLILVNGQSVNFKYPLQNNDSVLVYPVFEMLNISNVTHLREKPLRDIKFILDVHLGKLAKYLRILGFDTFYRNNCDDPEIIRISLNEHRIILTRDRGLLKVKKVTHGYFIRSQEPLEQLREVLNHFDLYHLIRSFTRCTKCNGLLQLTDKNRIDDQLEPLTRKYFDKFYQCADCRSIFWEGSHYDRLKSVIETIKKPE
jgi:uncharacterized protein with PIN domain